MIAGAVVVVVVEEVGDECFEVVRGQSGGLVNTMDVLRSWCVVVHSQ